MDAIIIKSSKTKIVLVMLVSILFVVIGVYMWNASYKPYQLEYSYRHYSPIQLRVYSVADFLFFGIGAIMAAVKLFDKRPAIIIDQQGINIIGYQFIKWNDVIDYSTVKIKSTKILLLYVQNPKEYIAAASNLKKMGMKFTMKQYKTPFGLSSNSYQCSFDELKAAVLEGMKQAALAKRNNP